VLVLFVLVLVLARLVRLMLLVLLVLSPVAGKDQDGPIVKVEPLAA